MSHRSRVVWVYKIEISVEWIVSLALPQEEAIFLLLFFVVFSFLANTVFCIWFHLLCF